jgi:hypothetical protein
MRFFQFSFYYLTTYPDPDRHSKRRFRIFFSLRGVVHLENLTIRLSAVSDRKKSKLPTVVYDVLESKLCIFQHERMLLCVLFTAESW